MTKNRTPTPVCLDPGMHPGLEVKGLSTVAQKGTYRAPEDHLHIIGYYSIKYFLPMDPYLGPLSHNIPIDTVIISKYATFPKAID